MNIHWQKYILVFLTVCISVNCFEGGYTLGNWSYTSSLNVARSNNSAATNGQYVWTIGGYSYNSTPYPIEYAQILPDGSLSSWSEESTNTHDLRDLGLTMYANGFLYAIGGGGNVSDSTTVERAQINPDGTLSTWTTISILPAAFAEASLVQTTSYIYIIGGYYTGSDVYRTGINHDGSLGTWTLLSSKLVMGRRNLMSLLVNTTIYVIGGDIIPVERATIFPNGELSTFTTISNTVAAHEAGGLFYDGQYLNVVGGYFGGDLNYRSERAQVNPDGSLGSWQPASYLEMERDFFGYTQTTSACYVIGASEGGDSNSVEYAPILNTTDIKKSEWEIFD